jgi:hypothetical protein
VRGIGDARSLGHGLIRAGGGAALDLVAQLHKGSISARALKSDAERKAREARGHYNGLPVPPSASPLADLLGVEGSRVDLVTAVLSSIAANGLGAFLVACAAHVRRPEPVRVIAANAVEVVSSAPMEALSKSEPRRGGEQVRLHDVPTRSGRQRPLG